MKYPQKPPEISDEEWEEEYLYPLTDKKVDNANHSAVQFRLYSTLTKLKKLLIVLGVLLVGIVALINPDALIQTILVVGGAYFLYQITLNDETWSVWDIFEENDE